MIVSPGAGVIECMLQQRAAQGFRVARKTLEGARLKGTATGYEDEKADISFAIGRGIGRRRIAGIGADGSSSKPCAS
jgi:hypothetical protein